MKSYKLRLPSLVLSLIMLLTLVVAMIGCNEENPGNKNPDNNPNNQENNQKALGLSPENPLWRIVF